MELPVMLKRRSTRDILLLSATVMLLLLAAWQVVAWLHSGRRPDPDTYVTFHLKCLNCGEEFLRTRGQMPPAAKAMFFNTTEMRVDCPKCGAHQGAIMRKCPHCGQLYVSVWTRGDQSPGVRDICPHCNTDVTLQTQAPELLHSTRIP